MRKKIFAFSVVLLCLCICFSGCNLTVLSADDLIRPPKLSGESSFLQKEFERTINKEFIQMKMPINGENRSSYVIFDIDSDGEDDGLVFYSDPSVDNFARVAVFKHDGNVWKNVSNIVGLAEEIYELSFNDINGDGVYEILISWTNLNPDSSANETLTLDGNRALTIYRFTGSGMTLLKTEYFTKMYIGDFNCDSADDIFLTTVNVSIDSNNTTGRILTFKEDSTVDFDKSFSMIGMLDIVSITSDTVNTDNEPYSRIYVDGALSDAVLVTDVVQLSANSNQISFPLSENKNDVIALTARSSKVLSCDIDGDGFIEIPTLQELPYSKSINSSDSKPISLNLVVWSQLHGEKASVKFKTLYNKANNYYFVFEDEWISNVTAVYNSNTSLLTFYSVKNNKIADRLFSVMTFSKSSWEENKYQFDMLFDGDAYVYGYKYEINPLILKQKIRENFFVMD